MPDQGAHVRTDRARLDADNLPTLEESFDEQGRKHAGYRAGEIQCYFAVVHDFGLPRPIGAFRLAGRMRAIKKLGDEVGPAHRRVSNNGPRFIFGVSEPPSVMMFDLLVDEKNLTRGLEA